MHSPLLCSFCSISVAPPRTPPPSPAWVMACVDFLSLWEVVLHGSPLSSCFHACPLNRPSNPSWYLYRPWFSWYSCSLPSSPFYFSPAISLLALWFSYLAPFPLPPVPAHFVSLSLIMCSYSRVSIYYNSFSHRISPPRKTPRSSVTVRIPLNSDQSYLGISPAWLSSMRAESSSWAP